MHVRELFDLTGRCALVTGGSRGLGLSLAQALGEMGARLALVARKPDELEQACSQLAGLGIEARAFACDVSDPAAVAALVPRVAEALGEIDILVNNAGTSWGAPAESHPLQAWKRVIDTNLTGVFALTQAVGVRSMIPRRRGRIINIASIAGMRGTPPGVLSALAYNTSKGGLVNFTRSLAAEWGRHGITVNAIAPGFFPTRMSGVVIERAREQILSLTPLGRLGEGDDLKGAVVLLASEAGRFISGQILGVDGGMSAL